MIKEIKFYKDIGTRQKPYITVNSHKVSNIVGAVLYTKYSASDKYKLITKSEYCFKSWDDGEPWHKPYMTQTIIETYRLKDYRDVQKKEDE